MCAEAPTILLVGRDFTPGSRFFERLCRHGCACAIARSLNEARAALRSGEFDVVLSEMALPDGSALPLLRLLDRTPASLFFCVVVHDSCWWLPALARGRRTWGQAALRPAEFAHELATLLGADVSLSAADSAAPAPAEHANVIPIRPPEFVSPKPQRVLPEKAKAQKSSG